MITYNYNLTSDLTVTLNQGDTAFIKVNGNLSTFRWSFHILDAGATATAQVGLESYSATQNFVLSDLTLENIKVATVKTASLTSDVTNDGQEAPNLIYIANTSGSAKRVRFNFRGNR